MRRDTEDLSGRSFGRLTAIRLDGWPYWWCVCSCGKAKQVRASNLRNGSTTSCGCYGIEVRKARATHGAKRDGKESKEYRSYVGAKARCTNPREPQYPRYGGRGIRFGFKSFQEFLSVLGPKPSPLHSVDRIDPDGDYAPHNVRWATPKEQANNRRNSKLRSVTVVTHL